MHKTGTKVFVGLSGGVDSAVSAALLKQQGYEVTGVFIRIAIPGYPCPAAADRLSAMRVAAHLDIPFIEVDLSKEYEEQVFKPSIAEWGQGRTPNPDTLCNEKIKFGIFFDFCIKQGAEFVATGHYAQVKEGLLYVSTDQNKDQTYFLWAVPDAALRQTLFPVGGLTKPEVRALAEKFGLPNSARPDSQGLCFLGDISLDDMLAHELPQTQGQVLSESGEVVGTHRGAALYTLGQRHGFELVAAGPHTEPHFVVAKDVAANTITVSPHRTPLNKAKTMIALTNPNWIGLVSAGPCKARFRYRQPLIPAELNQSADAWVVTLLEPHYVPEGQSVVLYRGERCLGGGVAADVTLE